MNATGAHLLDMLLTAATLLVAAVFLVRKFTYRGSPTDSPCAGCRCKNAAPKPVSAPVAKP